MMYLKRSCVLLVLLAIAYSGYSGDSLRMNSFNSMRILNIENLWLQTGNTSGLFFNPQSELLMFDAGATINDGDFHRMREGGDKTCYSFNASSYNKIGSKFFVSGNFSYNNLDEKGALWSGTYDPYSGNPYLLADSVSGTTWHKENFRLAGQVAYAFSERWVFGCGIDYFVAVGAKQKDPRPENIVTKFEIHPSLVLKKENYTLGLDLGYKNSKEEIEYSTFCSSFSPTFFTFKGFGFYTKEVDTEFNRFQSGNELMGGFQFEKKIFGLQSLTDVRFNYSFEGIEDGSSGIKEDGGDWVTFKIKLHEQLKKISGNKIHLFDGDFSFLNGDGIGYDQDRVPDGDNYIYVTVSKNLKFNRKVFAGKVSYNYLSMLGIEKVGWDIYAAATFDSNTEEYYYVPETFSSAYFNASGTAQVQKNFYKGAFHFAPSLYASYTANLSNSLELSTLPEITDNQRVDVYTQEFNYYSADVLKVGGGVQVGYHPRSKNIDQINLTLMYDNRKPVSYDTGMTEICAKIGFIF